MRKVLDWSRYFEHIAVPYLALDWVALTRSKGI